MSPHANLRCGCALCAQRYHRLEPAARAAHARQGIRRRYRSVHGRLRSRHHRRRHQRRRHRARRRRPGRARAAAGAERPRLGHLVGLDQADPRRPALSRARRIPAGARGARRSARCCCGWRRTSSGRCASCCRRCRGRARRSCCGSGCCSTTGSARAKSCRRRAASISPTTSPASRCCGNSAPASNIPTAAVDDSRLVALNALDAAERGATIRTRTRVTRAEREDVWQLILNAQGHREIVTARVLVNAAGPWVGVVAETVLRIGGSAPVRLAKGSHIVVRKLFDHDRGYIFQNTDKRIVFALPFARGFHADRHDRREFRRRRSTRWRRARDEVIYLCRAVNEFFRERVEPRRRWCGRSPACARSTTTSQAGHAGGRHARLSSRARRALSAWRRCSRSTAARSRPIAGWPRTRSASLRISSSCTGAGLRRRRCRAAIFSGTRSRTRVAQTLRAWPFLSEAEAWRLVRAYGTRVERVLGDAKRREDIAPFFGPLSAAEVRYLMTARMGAHRRRRAVAAQQARAEARAAEKEALAQFMAAGRLQLAACATSVCTIRRRSHGTVS